jgi:hypothetical protein
MINKFSKTFDINEYQVLVLIYWEDKETMPQLVIRTDIEGTTYASTFDYETIELAQIELEEYTYNKACEYLETMLELDGTK